MSYLITSLIIVGVVWLVLELINATDDPNDH